MSVDGHDRDVLRELARRVAAVAAEPVQRERAELWRQLNALRPRRPMVLAFPEDGWSELLPDDRIQCRDELLRKWEWRLRASVFRHEHIHDDHPIADFFNVPWVVERGDFGLTERRQRSEHRGSYRWDPPVKTEGDLEKLHPRRIRVDHAETARRRDLAGEILGDILRVRVHGTLWWSVGLTQTLIHLRGLEQAMYDMYDAPELLHRLMAFLRDDKLSELDLYEAEGILSLNNGPDDTVGSGGIGCTDELPAEGFDGDGRVRCKDLWVLGESQEFSSVSPGQFDQFALRYQEPLLNRFGLACYGCCEPLERKLDLILARLPRLRRVSVSPWCDRRIAAEKLAARCIFSWKPNPSLVCAPRADWGEAERAIRETLEIARGCCVEMILKDTHTFHHDPTRVQRWTDLASRLAADHAA